MKPVWKGPLEDGITQSLISRMLACPYRSFLYYGLGLEEPRQPEPNLFWGNGIHLALEKLLRLPTRIKDTSEEQMTEVFNDVKKLLTKEWPAHPDTFPHSIMAMVRLYNDSYKDECGPIVTEQKFSVPYETRNGRKCTLRGKADGVAHRLADSRRKVLVEHKAKGKIDAQQTRVETRVDLQSLMYCYNFDTREIIYDLFRIPEAAWSTPPRNPMARAAAYVDVMFNTAKQWNDFPISRNKPSWIAQVPLTITEEDIERMICFTLDPIIEMIWERYELWCRPDFDPENPRFYGSGFYRVPIRQFDATRTEKYKCDYHSYLTDQLGLNELVPVKSFYSELEDGHSETD